MREEKIDFKVVVKELKKYFEEFRYAEPLYRPHLIFCKNCGIVYTSTGTGYYKTIEIGCHFEPDRVWVETEPECGKCNSDAIYSLEDYSNVGDIEKGLKNLIKTEKKIVIKVINNYKEENEKDYPVKLRAGLKSLESAVSKWFSLPPEERKKQFFRQQNVNKEIERTEHKIERLEKELIDY